MEVSAAVAWGAEAVGAVGKQAPLTYRSLVAMADSQAAARAEGVHRLTAVRQVPEVLAAAEWLRSSPMARLT